MGTAGRPGASEEDDRLAKLKSVSTPFFLSKPQEGGLTFFFTLQQFFDPPPLSGRSRAVSQSNESSHSEEATFPSASAEGETDLEKVKGQLGALRR